MLHLYELLHLVLHPHSLFFTMSYKPTLKQPLSASHMLQLPCSTFINFSTIKNSTSRGRKAGWRMPALVPRAPAPRSGGASPGCAVPGWELREPRYQHARAESKAPRGLSSGWGPLWGRSHGKLEDVLWFAVEARTNSEALEKQTKLYPWFPHCPRYCLGCVIQVTWFSCSVFSHAMGGMVGTAESKSAGTPQCCWDHPQAQSLLPAQVGAGSFLVGAWMPRGHSVQQQQEAGLGTPSP